MEAVVEGENMSRALRRVRSDKGVAGVDGMTVDELLPYLNGPASRFDSVNHDVVMSRIARRISDKRDTPVPVRGNDSYRSGEKECRKTARSLQCVQHPSG